MFFPFPAVETEAQGGDPSHSMYWRWIQKWGKMEERKDILTIKSLSFGAPGWLYWRRVVS